MRTERRVALDRRALERRTFPRYSVEFPVSLGINTSNGEKFFRVDCVNLSRTSLEIACDINAIESLMAQEHPQSCELEFQLPGDGEKFVVVAKVLTLRRLSQHKYYLVMVFTTFNQGSEELLSDFLEHQKIPG